MKNAPVKLFICYNRSQYPKIESINKFLLKTMNIKQKNH
ncbi:hypothetical protein BAT_3328 [Bacillus pumilus ATCC 7061]|nr:hypothetical protein BAT_3328 [Bacillus pumilus ATCC 7061]